MSAENHEGNICEENLAGLKSKKIEATTRKFSGPHMIIWSCPEVSPLMKWQVITKLFRRKPRGFLISQSFMKFPWKPSGLTSLWGQFNYSKLVWKFLRICIFTCCKWYLVSKFHYPSAFPFYLLFLKFVFLAASHWFWYDSEEYNKMKSIPVSVTDSKEIQFWLPKLLKFIFFDFY